MGFVCVCVCVCVCGSAHHVPQHTRTRAHLSAPYSPPLHPASPCMRARRLIASSSCHGCRHQVLFDADHQHGDHPGHRLRHRLRDLLFRKQGQVSGGLLPTAAYVVARAATAVAVTAARLLHTFKSPSPPPPRNAGTIPRSTPWPQPSSTGSTLPWLSSAGRSCSSTSTRWASPLSRVVPPLPQPFQ